jgi:molecular chaperone GrpE
VTDTSNPRDGAPTQPPVRVSGEGLRGNREVPSTDPARQQLDQFEQQDQVPGHGPGPGPEVEERLAAAEAKAQEHLDDLKRLAAEFENYKKRTAREQASLSTRATERLVKELLPIIDDLERALEAAEEHEEAKLEEGVRLVHRQLASALEREGLAVIETDGKFDPHVHEALLSQPSEADEGSVIEVLQKGYRLGDRVLRPARVVVAAAKEANGHDQS